MTAMDRALADIGRAFGDGAAARYLKSSVRAVLRRLENRPDDPAIAMRYGARARMITARSGADLAVAIILVERWLREERRAFQIASAFGRGSRLSVQILSELRLILRWMRRKKMDRLLAEVGAELAEHAA